MNIEVEDVYHWIVTHLAEVIGLATLLIAIIGGAIKYCLTRKSHGMEEEQLALNYRLAEIEEGRESERITNKRQAVLQATIVLTENKSRKLRIENLGEADARNVSVFLNCVPFENSDYYATGVELITEIPANSSIERLLSIHMGSRLPIQLRVVWDDESAEQRVYRSELS